MIDRRLCGGVILALLCTLCVQVKGQIVFTDTLNNDDFAHADDTGLVNAGTAVLLDGQLGESFPSDYEDYFFLTVTEEAALPLHLQVTMRGVVEDVWRHTSLYDSEELRIMGAQTSEADEDIGFETYIVEPGLHYVMTHAVPYPGIEVVTYELEIISSEVKDPAGVFGTDQDTCIPAPTLLALFTDQFIGDGPVGRADVDCFCFKTGGPSIVSATVTSSHRGLLEPMLKAGPTGALITPFEQLRPDLKAHSVRAAAFGAGEARVCVSGGETQSGSVGFYDLAFDVHPVSTGGGPLEPNDSISQATPTGLSGPGSVGFAGELGDGVFGELRGDVDFYRIENVLDERLDVSVRPADGSSVMPVVHLYNDLGIKLETWAAGEDGRAGGSYAFRCADLPGLPPASLDLYVAIQGAGARPPRDPFVPNPDVQTYSLDQLVSLHAVGADSASTGPYEATFAVHPADLTDCGSEPNETLQEATDTQLVDKGVYTCDRGFLDDGPCATPDLNVDFFAVHVANPPVLLSIAVNSGGCGDPRSFQVFDADGVRVGGADQDFWEDTLWTAGTYYISVSYARNEDFDPQVPCSGGGDASEPQLGDYYWVEIRLEPPEASASPAVASASASPMAAVDDASLFATSLGGSDRSVVELDAATGAEITGFVPPETIVGGGEGLALEGDDVFFLGRSRNYPYLYRLDAGTGRVLERITTWFGSGFYGDITAINSVLYVVDKLDDAIYALPTTSLKGGVRRLPVGETSGISMFGPIAGAAIPYRLVVTDATDSSKVHHISPLDGSVVTSMSLGTNCQCNADADGDGDVDDEDALRIQSCGSSAMSFTGRLADESGDSALDGGPATPFDCQFADLNCDGILNWEDDTILDCQWNGPDLPPNEGCCPEGLPSVPVHATSLAATGEAALIAGNWTAPNLHVFDRGGRFEETVGVDAPVGKLGGESFGLLGDGDGNATVDLLDYAVLQRCLPVNGVMSGDGACAAFDFDIDDDVDLSDYAEFFVSANGVGS